MEISKDIVDREIELTKMKLEVVGSPSLNFVFSFLALLTSLGISINKDLFGYWIPAAVIIALLLGIKWFIPLVEVFWYRGKVKVPQEVKTLKITPEISEYLFEISYEI